MSFSQEGMDLNPVFTDASKFHPSGSGGELKLFELSKILLVWLTILTMCLVNVYSFFGHSKVHGWLVDPQSSEYDIVAGAGDYDTYVHATRPSSY